jgi:hypothetical protein
MQFPDYVTCITRWPSRHYYNYYACTVRPFKMHALRDVVFRLNGKTFIGNLCCRFGLAEDLVSVRG